jgi:hypothetical protein
MCVCAAWEQRGAGNACGQKQATGRAVAVGAKKNKREKGEGENN